MKEIFLVLACVSMHLSKPVLFVQHKLCTRAVYCKRICRDACERLPYGTSRMRAAGEGNLCHKRGIRELVH